MKALFLIVLFPVSFLVIKETENIKPKPLWKDPRALYKTGRIQIIEEAFDELVFLGLIDKSFWDNNIDEFYYIHENNDCKKSETDAVYKHVYKKNKKIRNGLKVTEEKCRDKVVINANVFELGYYVLDPAEDYLRSKNRNDINFKWALNIKEAVMYLILHEYTHACGHDDHAVVDAYVNKQILEIRKRDNQLPYRFIPLSPSDISCGKNKDTFVLAIKHDRIPPPEK